MVKQISILFFVLVVLSSCEKVIDIDLNDANPSIVIEGNIHNGEGPVTVTVSQTGSYFDEFSVKKISGADVRLYIDGDKNFQLKEVREGIYQLRQYNAEINRQYKLKVTVGNEVYEAVSIMNPPVSILNLDSEYEEGVAFMEPGYNLTCIFHDPEGFENYYRIKVYVNSELMNGAENYFIFKDQLFDGNNIEFLMRRNLFKKGDSITVDLLSIDKSTYEYFHTLRDIIGVGYDQSAAPTNPISNFSNGALGYFSAYSYDSKSIVIK